MVNDGRGGACVGIASLVATGSSISRILLVYPPYRQLVGGEGAIETAPAPRLSLGLASVSSCVEHKTGIACDVYCSADYSMATLTKVIRTQKPSMLGISCLSFNRFACFKLAEMAKRIDPSIVVVWGGVHATLLDEQILSTYSCVDFIVRGEGELTFCGLVEAINNKKSLSAVAGITFRDGARIVRTVSRPRLTCLDDLPLIDYKRFGIEPVRDLAIKDRLNDALPVETTRGCPFGCTYCGGVGFMGRHLAHRSIENIMAQIKLIPRDMSGGIFFHDMNFTLDKDRARAICRALIKENITLPWVCSTRIDLVDRELLLLMKTAGCEAVFYGVDSLCQHILSSIGRHYEPDVAVRNANLTVSVGIKAYVNLIIGFPGETQEDIIATFIKAGKFSKDVPVVVNGLKSMPGSCLYQQALKEGFDESYWLKDHPEMLPYYTGAMSQAAMLTWIRLFYIYRETGDVARKKELLACWSRLKNKKA